MSRPSSAEFSISLEDSLAFAALSGDFNPLHVDPVAARRTQFGSTVVHGIHAALKALDALADSWLPPGHEPIALSATFHNPVRTGAAANVVAAAPGADGRIRITAESAGRPAFTLNLRTGPANPGCPVPIDGQSPRKSPRPLPFPPPIQGGEVPLCINRALLTRLFPTLAARGSLAWITDLAATTNIVGMDCPGLDSIYSGFKLTRRDGAGGPALAAMQYRLERTDPRFRLARLSVRGLCLEGTLDTFFRPPVVAQKPLQEVMNEVAAGTHAGQRAIVIGGSRGLGEIAAKILLAGDAEVTVTYARGQQDAERLQAEASAAGKTCRIARLDVSNPLPDAVRTDLADGRFTHVYFFASPHIERNASGRWDSALFDRFTAIYVRGFIEVVEAAVDARRKGQDAPLQVMYPSSVFLDTDEPGFAEYCSAKAAGETAARHMMQTMPLEVHVPRLSRMRTDQTSALVDAGVEDAFPVIRDQLRRYGA